MWQDIVSRLLVLIALGIIGVATKYLITFLHAKANETDSKFIKNMLNMIEDIVNQCVLATNQTYVDALKKEGNFDLLAQKEAFNITLELVQSSLNDACWDIINEMTDDPTAYITSLIESSVKTSKN